MVREISEKLQQVYPTPFCIALILSLPMMDLSNILVCAPVLSFTGKQYARLFTYCPGAVM
jgi:hypothetical protein